MKKNVLFLLIVLTALPVLAQRGMNNNSRIETITKELNLSEKQVKEITKIYEVQRAEMNKLRESFSGDRKGMFAKMQKLFAETDEKILNLLNDEQKLKYKKIIKSRAQRGKSRDRNRGRRR